MPSKLYPEDQARVDEYLKTGVNSVERKPFRMWTLLGVIVLVMFALGGVSLMLARMEGVI
ncbi:DUF3094 family protein [Marinimicrobium alkaliphilum]|uniref:DUF3094 family protein n=1 Tax=Marinimicrobium alkaliphilum TaxID=2202654 RepID=UPI000DB9D8A8|nr:DUF3094 family protein [Marinimicrobium alkaliphilum]